jgi:hypothetical protein
MELLFRRFPKHAQYFISGSSEVPSFVFFVESVKLSTIQLDTLWPTLEYHNTQEFYCQGQPYCSFRQVIAGTESAVVTGAELKKALTTCCSSGRKQVRPRRWEFLDIPN